MNDLYRLLWIFLIYAFVGWCVEVIYAALVLGKFVNRGFLNGPVCPIYGVGMIAVSAILTPIEGDFFALFFGSVALTTALEFIVGFILEKFFGEKWWDYSDERLNIKGYVCAKFSLLWGIGCVAVMKAVHPAVMLFIESADGTFWQICAYTMTTIIAFDALVTITATVKMRYRLRSLDSLGAKIKGVSDKIGGTIADSTLTVKDKYEESRERLDEKYGDELDELKEKYENKVDSLKEKYGDEIEEIKEKYARELTELKEKISALIDKNSFIYRRILNAYPKLGRGLERESIRDLMNFHRAKSHEKNPHDENENNR